MSREDLGVHSPVIPGAGTEWILETLIWGGFMQHVEMASQGRRGSWIRHLCQMCFKFSHTFLNGEPKVKWQA